MVDKTPKIRFKEYTSSWEQRKLGEISNKVTKKNQDAVVDEVFTNSAEFGIISQRDFFEKDIANAENIDGYYVVEPDDFVYNPRISATAPFGPIKRNKLERTGAMSPLYYVFRPYDIDLSYLEWYFQTTCWHSFMRFNGNSGARSDRFAITDKIFNEMPISMPQDIVEQKLIGTFLTKLESLITLHQRKYDKLTNVKKSMLEKMFPKNGSNVPEIRFKGFSDAWEQRKLSEVAEIVGGGTPSTNVSEYWDGDIDWYAPAEINDQIYVDGSERKITKLGLEKSSAKILPADKTVLFTSRAGIGKTAILRRSGATNQGFQSMVLNDETNPYFVFSMSEFIKEEAERVASGSTFAEVSGKMLGNLTFMFPTKQEQDKIGEYFSNLDHLITLQQRKLEKLKCIKKSLLENMFV